MKVLLLGGTGTLSYDVLKCSMQQHYNVSILNRGKHNSQLDNNICVYIADLKNPEIVKSKLHNDTFDVIVDFFSRTKEDICNLFPIMGKRCKQYIFISSACVYCRDNKSTIAITENSSKPNPFWIYNVQKYEAEKQLINLSNQTECYYTIIRPYITYNDERIPLGLVPKYCFHRTIIERMRSGKPMFVWDGGENYCTLTYSKDFAKALVGLYLNPMAKNEDFHITSDFCYKWKDVLSIIYDKLQIKPNIVDIPVSKVVKYLPEYKDELIGDRCLNAIFDNSKIKQAVHGLSFNTSLEDGVNSIIRYYDRLKEYNYDFKYDARIDRMLSSLFGKRLGFIPYPNCKLSDKYIYQIYRYAPLRIANRLDLFFERIR